ncbi:nucleoside monophosphate kinase [bacterium]|nr:MAG: nucleoside monophosphate kinase [bacterium]
MQRTPRTKSNMQLNLIFLGDVAAGKATQSAYFAKKYKLYDFDMGRELTLLREKQRDVNHILKKNYDKGILAPTQLCRQILRDTISSVPKTKGILFDGHPKMVQEARLARKLLAESGRTKPLVVYITIPVEETKKRIASRQGYKGTNTTRRSDDTLKGLQNRAKYYRINIRQVIKYFSSVYKFERISGMGTPVQVRARIQKAIDLYIKNNQPWESQSKLSKKSK